MSKQEKKKKKKEKRKKEKGKKRKKKKTSISYIKDFVNCQLPDRSHGVDIQQGHTGNVAARLQGPICQHPLLRRPADITHKVNVDARKEKKTGKEEFSLVLYVSCGQKEEENKKRKIKNEKKEKKKKKKKHNNNKLTSSSPSSACQRSHRSKSDPLPPSPGKTHQRTT